jgi:hypothetical protein
MRDVISGTGSRFLLCKLAAVDRRYPKYPPQPLRKCSGYVKESPQNAPFERTAGEGANVEGE